MHRVISTILPTPRLIARALFATLAMTALLTPKLAVADGGLHLRTGLGVGGVALDREVSGSAGGFTVDAGDSTVRGGGGAFDLAVGGFIAPRLAISAALVLGGVGEATLEADNGDELDLEDGLGFALLGVALDVTPAAGQSGVRGWITIGLAGAWARLPEPNLFEGIGGAGVGLQAGVGYAWTTSPRWNLGIGASFLAAGLRGEDEELGIRASERDSFAAVLVSANASYCGR